MALDIWTLVFTAGSSTMAVIIGIFSLKSIWKKNKEEQQELIDKRMTEKTDELKAVFKEMKNEVQYRFSQNERDIIDSQDDIEDIEDDVKQMNKDMQSICEKLSKFNYVIDDLIPNFKNFKGEFYRFKDSVDRNIPKSDSLVSNNSNIPIKDE